MSAEAAAKRAAEMVPEKLRNLVDLTVAPAVAAEANDDDSVKVEDVRAALDDPGIVFVFNCLLLCCGCSFFSIFCFRPIYFLMKKRKKILEFFL